MTTIGPASPSAPGSEGSAPCPLHMDAPACCALAGHSPPACTENPHVATVFRTDEDIQGPNRGLGPGAVGKCGWWAKQMISEREGDMCSGVPAVMLRA